MKGISKAARGAAGKYKNALRDNDRGYERLKREFERMETKPPMVKVGILGDSTKNQRADGTLSNVEIGTIHEYGAAGMPERSFLRSTMEENQAKYRKMMALGLRQMFVLRGVELKAGAERLMDLVGMRAAADVKKKITDGIPPPNAPSTIAAKGSSTPLVDTGQLLNSISWAVVEGEK